MPNVEKMTSRDSILKRVHLHCSHDTILLKGSLSELKPSALTTWLEQLRAVHASIDEVTGIDELELATRLFLERQPYSELVLSPDPKLSQLSLALNSQAIKTEQRQAKPSDKVIMTTAYAGIIETGTLVMMSSADTPTGNNFLPECAIILVDVDRLVPTMESLWQLMDAEGKKMPRALNFISGPSKTADIEQTLVYGAHGPKVLHILLFKSEM